MNHLNLCVLAAVLLHSQTSWSDPFNPLGGEKSDAPLLSAHDPASDRFRSVGHLRSTIGIGWRCTATLVAGSASPSRDRPALILTAGHCGAGMTGDNDVVVDRPMTEGWFFTPSYFVDNVEEHVDIPIVSIRYSSMKSADLAVMQLGETYGQLLDRGFKPVQLSAKPSAAHGIEMAHIPMGLFPNHFLRHSVCKTRPPAVVFETPREERADTPWLFLNAVPNDCIGVYSGSSGAPVFVKDGREVIGIHSTGLREAGCGAFNPCEIEEGQPVDKVNSSYFGSIAPLIGSFKPDGSFDSTDLDPGTGIVLNRQGLWDSAGADPAEQQKNLRPRWNLFIDVAHEMIRYKTGFADQVHCSDVNGYSEPEYVTSQPLLGLEVPTAKGIYALCAVGKRPGSSQWQPFAQATVKLRKVD